jgi:hypothetical protein
MAQGMEHLRMSEIALVILLKKRGICSSELIEKTIALKIKLKSEGVDKDIEKILLQIRAISPVVLGDLIPDHNTMMQSIKVCSHCKKDTFFNYKLCVHCNKELKLSEVFPEKREYYPTLKGEAPHCLNCRTQEWEDVDECKACGSSLATGEPGPDTVVCGDCKKILRYDAAICDDCGESVSFHQHKNEQSVVEKYGVRVIVVLFLCFGTFLLKGSILLLVTGETYTDQSTTMLSENAKKLHHLKNDEKNWRYIKEKLGHKEYRKAIILLSKLEQTDEVKELSSILHIYLAIENFRQGSRVDAKKHLYDSRVLSEELYRNFFK